MSRLRRLVYSSAYRASAEPFSQVVQTILVKSIQNNRLVDVTGMLVAGEGRFLQLLEGPAATVGEVFDRIAADPRHGDVVVLLDTAADQRLFRDWNMAQRQIGSADQALLRKFGLEAFEPSRLAPDQALELIQADSPTPV